MRKESWGVRRLALSGAGLIAVVSLLVWVGGYLEREDTRARFAAQVQAWAKLELPAVENEPGPYLRGQLVVVEAAVLDWKPTWGVVEIQPARLDAGQFELPSHLQADSPEEVGTVVVCAHKREPLDLEYRLEGAPAGSGIRAFRYDIQVTLYDLERGVCAGQTTLRGSEPQDIMEIGDTSVGEPPDVQAWLQGLPWRPAQAAAE